MSPDKQARTSVDYDSGISERAWRKITSQVNRGAAAFFEKRGLPVNEYGTPRQWNEAPNQKTIKLKKARRERNLRYQRDRALREYREKHGIPLDMPKRKPGQFKQWKELLYHETHKTCPPASPAGTASQFQAQ